MNSMQHQRWQGELIDHLGFIFTITEVRDIVFMRDVCLGNDHRAGCHSVGNRTEKLDKAVCLLKMDAAGSWNLPHKPNGVEANVTRPFRQVMEQYVNHRNQYLRRGEVEIDLVITERGPKMTHASIMQLKWRQQR